MLWWCFRPCNSITFFSSLYATGKFDCSISVPSPARKSVSCCFIWARCSLRLAVCCTDELPILILNPWKTTVRHVLMLEIDSFSNSGNNCQNLCIVVVAVIPSRYVYFIGGVIRILSKCSSPSLLYDTVCRPIYIHKNPSVTRKCVIQPAKRGCWFYMRHFGMNIMFTSGVSFSRNYCVL